MNSTNRPQARKLPVLLLCFVLPVFFAYTYTGTESSKCQEARKLYEKAGASHEDTDKIRLYRESIRLCPGFAAYYMLGLVYMKTDRFLEAAEALEEAVKLNHTTAEAYFILGDAYRELKQADAAFLNYKLGLGLKEIPVYKKRCTEARVEMMKKDPDAKTIRHVLQRGLTFRSRGIGIVPSVDVKVEFDFDKASLSPEGKNQAAELGKALRSLLDASPGGIGKIRLTGHTDTRGSHSYNDRLSLERARSVKAYLVQSFGLHGGMIVVTGKGKREPLLPDADSEDQHRLNRRVEVIIEPQ